jgi:DNA-binding Xre family transcriptional regulator
MSDIMVKSRLKLLMSERNTERIRAGQPELTIRQLAADAGVPPSVVSGLTSGRAQQVHFRTLDKLCKALKVTPGDILEYVPETPTE